jgi:hypothetical protein
MKNKTPVADFGLPEPSLGQLIFEALALTIFGLLGAMILLVVLYWLFTGKII